MSKHSGRARGLVSASAPDAAAAAVLTAPSGVARTRSTASSHRESRAVLAAGLRDTHEATRRITRSTDVLVRETILRIAQSAERLERRS